MYKYTTERALRAVVYDIYRQSADPIEFEKKITDFSEKGVYVLDVEEPYEPLDLMELI